MEVDKKDVYFQILAASGLDDDSSNLLGDYIVDIDTGRPLDIEEYTQVVKARVSEANVREMIRDQFSIRSDRHGWDSSRDYYAKDYLPTEARANEENHRIKVAKSTKAKRGGTRTQEEIDAEEYAAELQGKFGVLIFATKFPAGNSCGTF